jgi:lipoprotein-anchoring transpeptidase ErfK/SrfK
MTRRIVSILVCTAVVLALVLPAVAAEGVSGKWKVTAKSQRGERTYDVTIEQTGDKLVVTQKDRQGNDLKSEGTVKGSEITWTTKRQTPNGEFTITYKGKVEGKTMSGTSETPMGTGEWKAEKVE